MKNVFMSLIFAFVALIFIACDSKNADPTIIANLQTAYNGESNASAKYKMYAQACDSAKYKGCCALFKAASHAEAVHAKLEAEALKKLGVEPKCEIILPSFINVTNALQDAIKGEKYECTIMYPGFMKTAQDKGYFDVVRVFNLANTAEIEHARLYNDALNDLEAHKLSNKIYAVCNICGFTVDEVFNKCPICNALNEIIIFQ